MSRPSPVRAAVAVLTASALAVAAVVASVTLGPVSPASAAATDTVTFAGSGYGHGVGMSQYGARGQAVAGRTADQILTHYFTGAAVTSVVDNADITVNLVHKAPSVRFRSVAGATGGGTVHAVIGGHGTVVGTAADTFSVAVSAGRLAVSKTRAGVVTTYPSTTAVTVRWAGTRFMSGTSTLLDVAQPGETLGTKRYRHGTVAINLVGGAIELNNVVRLHDEYLFGVAEMPSSWPTEALKAQAIASRSYALKARGSGSLNAACLCHVYDGVVSQVFAGWAKENEAGGWGAVWKAAVNATATSSTTAKAVTYQGSVISAYFASSTGGKSRASSDVWGGVLPWAVSVPDPWSLDPANNPNASWSRTVTVGDLRAKLFTALPNIARVQLVGWSSDGTLRTITAWSSSGASQSKTGDQLRSALGLKSAWIKSMTTTLPSANVDVYTTPGIHVVNGREWKTTCGPYSSSATRCFTYIKATVTKATPTGYVTSYDWAFNTITYVDASSARWASNPLAKTGTFVSAGRQWKVACSPNVTTGPRTCTAWVWTSVISRQGTASGGYTYRVYSTWVLNNVVRLTG